MSKVLELKKLEDGFYLMEYETDFILFKRKFRRKIFKGMRFWRYLDTGFSLPYSLEVEVEYIYKYLMK